MFGTAIGLGVEVGPVTRQDELAIARSVTERPVPGGVGIDDLRLSFEDVLITHG